MIFDILNASFAMNLKLFLTQILTKKKSLQADTCKLLDELVRPARFELAAYGFVVRRSIQAELRAHLK